MGRYRKVDTRVWNDEKFRSLSQEAKYLFIYLLTSPHSTAWGAYVLDDLYIEADLGYSKQRINNLWGELIHTGIVFREKNTRLVCLPNWFKYNIPENQKTISACVNGILSLPKSPILSKYCSSSEWVSEQLAKRNLTIEVSEQLANGSEINSERLEGEHEQRTTNNEQDSKVEEQFNIFYASYPKHEGKTKALESWKKIKPDVKLFERIIKSVEARKRSENWTKENGKYIPLPATWLNQKRWEDEILVDELITDQWGKIYKPIPGVAVKTFIDANGKKYTIDSAGRDSRLGGLVI